MTSMFFEAIKIILAQYSFNYSQVSQENETNFRHNVNNC